MKLLYLILPLILGFTLKYTVEFDGILLVENQDILYTATGSTLLKNVSLKVNFEVEAPPA